MNNIIQDFQKRALDNKIKKGFNITNIEKEFCLLYGEVGEAYEAYRKKKDDLGEELADIAIYLFGIAEILNFDLSNEIENKLKINEQRIYKKINGVSYKIKKEEL